MSEKDIRIKWDNNYRDPQQQQWPAAEVLAQNVHLLPGHGRALDLACGMGANAMMLAQRGMQTDAWDISQVAVDSLNQRAQALGLPVQACVRNVEQDPPPPLSYDVIVVAHFLYRPGCGSLLEALRPGGLLFYQTFTRHKVVEEGPKSTDFLLEENELLQLFAPLRVVVYREEGALGEVDKGFRNKAMFVGVKR